MSLYILLVLISTFLLGCQSETNITEAAEIKSESQLEESEKLTLEGEIAKVAISKKRGIDPVVYKKAEDLEAFNNIFSSAIKEPGTANMVNPDVYLEIAYKDGNEQTLHLWLGGNGEISVLMSTDATSTIYTLSEAMTDTLTEIVGK
ncbi:hypothetical protein [Planococcus shixiaomingii]|uniref:hypothetical protein n=1 Tax=Planococcus shixiaomingii TaxID=3058393 RepID=UPI0026113A84|nr:hypothetical protein [Planococcus sp. N022]WKA53196.1 hypothetical protein QWY21_11050 [Planococcus sp. N022]